MTGELAAALAALQEKLPHVAKTLTARVKHKDGTGYHEYGYADLAMVSAEILPKLGALGLSWVTKPMLIEGGAFVLDYKLQHNNGESEQGQYPLPKGSPQEIGSAITYARRYALCAVTGVAPEGDDDDAEKTTRAATRRRGSKAMTPDPAGGHGDDWESATPARPPVADAPGITAAQMRNLQRRFTIMYGRDRDAKLEYAVGIVDRPLTSSSELTTDEASRVIDALGHEPVVVEAEAKADAAKREAEAKAAKS